MAKAKDPKRVAAGKRSKAKGAKYQSDIAKKLREWSGQEFRSTPRSGGLRWNGAWWTFGDLIPPEDTPLVIECKHYHEVPFIDVLGNRRSEPGGGIVNEWWYSQACEDAARASTQLGATMIPLLIWKQDFCPSRITCDLELFNSLGEYGLVTVVTGTPGRRPHVTVDLLSFLGQINFDQMLMAITRR